MGLELEYLGNDEPQLYVTNNINDEMYDFESDHYEIIGSSNFEELINDINLAKN